MLKKISTKLSNNRNKKLTITKKKDININSALNKIRY